MRCRARHAPALTGAARDLEWARGTEGVSIEKPKDPLTVTEDDLLKHGKNLMQETTESADTAIRILEDTKIVRAPERSDRSTGADSRTGNRPAWRRPPN